MVFLDDLATAWKKLEECKTEPSALTVDEEDDLDEEERIESQLIRQEFLKQQSAALANKFKQRPFTQFPTTVSTKKDRTVDPRSKLKDKNKSSLASTSRADSVQCLEQCLEIFFVSHKLEIISKIIF